VKGDALRLAQVSAGIQTAGTALAAIEVGRSHLDLAEGAIGLIPAAYARRDAFAATFSWLTGSTGDVIAQLQGEVAQQRADLDRHAAFYKGYEGDDLSQEISTAHSVGIASTLQYINKVINNVIDAVNDAPTVSALDFVQAVEDAIAAAAAAAAKIVNNVVQAAANVAAGAAIALWPVLAIIGAGAALYIFRAPLLRAVGKAAA